VSARCIVWRDVVTREVRRVPGGSREHLKLTCGHMLTRSLGLKPTQRIICQECTSALSVRQHEDALAALRALRDCGTLLVRTEHIGLLRLYGAGLANIRPYGKRGDDAVIYQLSNEGKTIAAEVLK